jgi:glycosyltransferase involved in cell wall biosynthesis
VTRPGGLWAVVPVFDEGATIAGVVRRVREHCPVVVVDDASGDDSARQAAGAGAEVVRHARRHGKGAALRTGFGAVLARGATLVVTLDGDGQHDPADVPRLAEAARGAPDAVVLGDRFAGVAGDRIPVLRHLAIRAADRLLAPLLPARVVDTQCGLRVYPAAFLRQVALQEEGFVLETEALVRAAQAGFRLLSIPVRRLYAEGRRSRFRTVTDAALIAWYVARARAGAAGAEGRAATGAPVARGLWP